MPAHNAQIAAVFEQMAALMEVLGVNRFKVIAMQKAARVLGDLTRAARDLSDDELRQIDGIGDGAFKRIREFQSTGQIAEYAELLAQVPPGLPALLNIPGVGPKTVALLWKEAGVDSLAALRSKLEGDSLARLKGFGEKKLENLRKNLAFTEQAGQRIRIGQALPLARWIVDQLRAVKGAQRVEYAGSLRRGQETIGDIDVLAACSEAAAAALADRFIALPIVADVIAHGPTKCSIRATTGVQCDLRLVRLNNFGAALLYFTGSKEHNVALRGLAQQQGLTLNEYALTRLDDKTVIASATEEDIFQALHLSWIPPELREDRGEIALAREGKLPALITRDDIQADLHTHTTASDGKWSIRELVQAALDRGFHTVAVTDHSKSQVQAHGLTAERLEQHIEAVREIAAEYKKKITVLAGSEVDILSDGSLDYPNSLLRELDVVVASPHAALTQPPDKATARLLRAIEHPCVTILGHPTGRIINYREGLAPDMLTLIKAAARRGIALEINANHHRLDLRDTHARLALEHGVKLAINTDAHGPDDLDELTYGVLTARRAGATKQDVVNCLGREALLTWLRGTRH
jgi:DNA polymerase (family 10)